MTTRWIWFVPSYIWVIVASRAVSAGRRPADGQRSAVSTSSAQLLPVLEHLQVRGDRLAKADLLTGRTRIPAAFERARHATPGVSSSSSLHLVSRS
jgi:hypothetical protein